VASVLIGYASSSTTVFVDRIDTVEYLKRDTLANNASMTIQHHPDAQGRQRKVRAYLGTTDDGASLASYATGADSDIDLKNETFSADRATGGTASASSTTIGSVSSAFDNDDSTVWGGITFPITVTYDLGPGNDKVIERFTLQDRTSDTGEMPEDFDIQGSNDDITYTTLGSWTGITWSGASDKQSFDFTNSTSYRYYRLNITAVEDGGNRAQLAEMELLEDLTDDRIAQTFNLSSSSDVKSVKLDLKKTGSPAGTITVRIETVSGGDPTGTLADANLTATLSESSLGTSYSTETITFGTSATLAAGDYAIVISSNRTASSTDYVSVSADSSSPGYTGGEAKTSTDGGTNWTSAGADLIFDVLAEGTNYDAPLVVAWTGSKAQPDIAVRFDDGSGANGDTQTTFTNESGSSLDVVSIVGLK
jgi:hypothetical protein